LDTAHKASGLRRYAIDLDLNTQSHAAVLRRLGVLSALVDDQIESVEATQAFMARERLGSIVLAEQVALPHARFDGINAPVVSVVRPNEPVKFEEGLVSLVVGILVPNDEPQQHLDLLRFWASLLRQEDRRFALFGAPTADHFYALVKDHAC